MNPFKPRSTYREFHHFFEDDKGNQVAVLVTKDYEQGRWEEPDKLAIEVEGITRDLTPEERALFEEGGSEYEAIIG